MILKKRVIEPAIKEINEKTPMQISYEQKKRENYCWHSTQFQREA